MIGVVILRNSGIRKWFGASRQYLRTWNSTADRADPLTILVLPPIADHPR